MSNEPSLPSPEQGAEGRLIRHFIFSILKILHQQFHSITETLNIKLLINGNPRLNNERKVIDKVQSGNFDGESSRK
jgi:hypothetical protein